MGVEAGGGREAVSEGAPRGEGGGEEEGCWMQAPHKLGKGGEQTEEDRLHMIDAVAYSWAYKPVRSQRKAWGQMNTSTHSPATLFGRN